METTTNPFQVFTHGDWIFYDLFEEYSSLISAQRSSIIVPFNVNGDGDVTSNFFFDVIISILQKNLKPNWKPYVLFLGFQQSKIDEKLLDEKIHSLINSKVESLGKLIEKLTSADELSNMEFNDQNNLHNLIGLWELLRKMAENGEKNWKFIDSKKIGNKELWKEIEKSFDKAKEMDASLNYSSSIVEEFSLNLKKAFSKHEGFISLNDITDLVTILKVDNKNISSKTAAKDLLDPLEEDMSFKYVSEVFDIMRDIGLVLRLPNDASTFVLNLPKTSLKDNYDDEHLQGLSEVVIEYQVETKINGFLNSTIIRYLQTIYQMEYICVHFIELCQKRIIFHFGPVEVDVKIDELNISICCRTLKVDEAASLLGPICKEISTIVEYSLYKCSTFYKRSIDASWNNEADNKVKNKEFFDSFNIMFVKHPVENSTKLGIINRNSLLRRLNKEMNPTFLQDLTVKILNNLTQLPVMDSPIFCHSVTISNCICIRNSSDPFFLIEYENEEIERVFYMNQNSYSYIDDYGNRREKKFFLLNYSSFRIEFEETSDKHILDISNNDFIYPGELFKSNSNMYFIADVTDNEILITENNHSSPTWKSVDEFQSILLNFTNDPTVNEHSKYLNKPIVSQSLVERLLNAKDFSLFRPTVLNERTKGIFQEFYNFDYHQELFEIDYLDNMSNKISSQLEGRLLIPNELRERPLLLKDIINFKYATIYPVCDIGTRFSKTPQMHIIRNFKDLKPENYESFHPFYSLPWFVQLIDYFCLLAIETGYIGNLTGTTFKQLLEKCESELEEQLHIQTELCDLHSKDKSLESFNVQETSDNSLWLYSFSKFDDKLQDIISKSSKYLLSLTLIENSLEEFPIEITTLKFLRELDISGNPIPTLPKELSLLTQLISMIFNDNILKDFPKVIFQLYNLKILHLSSISIQTMDYQNLLDRECIAKGKTKLYSSIGLDEECLKTIFKESVKDNKTQTKLPDEKAYFSAKMYERLPHMTSAPLKQLDNSFSLSKLETLNLSNQAFKTLDYNVKYLRHLKSLNLSYNLLLEEIDHAICKLPIHTLNLDGCPSLKTPPREIVNKGLPAIMSYMRRLHEGSVECRRTKLMLVGLGGAGKTSLIRKMTQSEEDTESEETLPDVTDGIDIKTWKINSIEYSIWDFAGQEVYYNTHQFFLTNRAIYFLLWNMRSGYEHSGLKFWLSSIACHAPNAPIFIVGTQIDKVEKTDLPMKELQRLFPQISSFHLVSSFTGQGIDKLVDDLITETLKEKYMDEKIPLAYLNFEQKMLSEKSFKNLLSWETVCQYANECGINDISEIFQATEFLHELGSIQHFQNEFLKSKIIINSQWIIDVMACLISVHETSIIEGKLMHKDLNKIWSPSIYPEELHIWLLRLTEEFDLTFPIKNEPASIIPCLLKIEEPKEIKTFFHEKIGENETRAKMVFRFDYLPTGLCNRAQVRLYQFSDDANMWKNGSFLVKNRHRGVLKQTDKNTVIIDARGPQPENILFLVYDIFKNLIQETFVGVKYDCYISCKECIHQGSTDPCLIPYTRIKRAIDLKIPFLQCTDNFHTLSITELKGMLPPETTSDFDFHLENDVRNLRKLRSQFDTYVVFLFSSKDLNNQTFENTFKIISNEIKNSGVSIKMVDESCESNIQNTILTLKEAKDILFLMSDHFLKSRICKELFLYSKKQLKVKTQIVLMEKSDNWKKDSDVGMLCADDLYINMQNPQNVKSKLVDLMCSLSSLSKSYRTKKRKTASCFISYCWSNSEEAVEKGTKRKEGAIGKVDPRRIKKLLEGEGISCWMDIEQVGQTGLIQDITEGLKSAKVVIACVSDEYVTSKNCQMEFRFAAMTLRLPIIIAVVGTGLNWMRSEIGMLSMDYQKVDLQYCEDNDNEILKFVKEHVKFEEDEEKEDNISETNIDESNNKIKLNELLELAERKFLKNFLFIHSHFNIRSLPHLPILDLEEGSENDTVLGYRFVFLCECDEGWHLPENFKSLKWNVSPDDEKTTEIIKTWSPYLARVYTLLKETDIPLVALNSNIGNSLVDKFNEMSSLSVDQLSTSYISMIEYLNETEIQSYFRTEDAYLKKCQIGNGDISWLCSYHQKQPRVNVLETDMILATVGKTDKYYEDILENIDENCELKRTLEVESNTTVNDDDEADEENPLCTKKSKVANLITKQSRLRSQACLLL
ncbi:DgyrCDS9496 [Dimorphilus gyrociliatus]|uniref:non-specific serine/threonine protein kinase n=1 Tax=Dimorphilus gyrociliatus TaxID=2664684 RepID=A0A7I8VYT1_9ANNE|nr:DgyrCDS9496 [Dimorphilus gyrociliatus]